MSAPVLEAVQHGWWEAMREPEALADAPDFVAGDDRMSAVQRIRIYQRMYWYRQVNALFTTCPRTARLLGRLRFTAVCRAFLEAHPSTCHELERIGEGLPDFLDGPAAAELDLAGLAHSLVAGVCRLEQARLASFLARDSAPVGLDALRPEAFAVTHLVLAPSMRLLHVPPGALPTWLALPSDLPEDGVVPDAPHPLEGFDPSVEALRAVLVWRSGREHIVSHRAIDADEARALALVADGHPLGEVLSAFSTDEPTRAATVLSRWFARGLIVDARLTS